MVQRCAVPGCKYRRGASTPQKISFHRFPRAQSEIWKKWVKFTNRENWTPKTGSRLCSTHFVSTDFFSGHLIKCSRIKPEAIPSVYVAPNTSNEPREEQENFESCKEECTDNPSNNKDPVMTIKCDPTDVVEVEECDAATFLIKEEVSDSEYSIRQTEALILPEYIKTEPTDEKNEVIVKSVHGDGNSGPYILPGIIDNLDIKTEPIDEEMCVYEVTTVSLIKDRVSSSVVDSCASLDGDSNPSFQDFRTILGDTESCYQDPTTSNYSNYQTCPDTKSDIDQDHVYCVTPSTSTGENINEVDNLTPEDSSNEVEQLVSVKEADIELLTLDDDTSGKVPMDGGDSSEEEREKETGQATTSDPKCCIDDHVPMNGDVEVRMPRLKDFPIFDTSGGTLSSKLRIGNSLKYVRPSDKPAVSKNTLKILANQKSHRHNFSYFLTTSIQKLKTYSRTHSSELFFKCDYKCTSNDVLNLHRRTHTAVKLHQCDLCDFSCKKKLDLIEHARTHSGEKPLKCQHCYFTCARKSDLLRHAKKHPDFKPYKCDYCDFTSSKKRYLMDHVRTHSGDKPFKCTQCDFICALKSYLTRHKKIHSILKCKLCDFTCTGKYTLRKHIRTH